MSDLASRLKARLREIARRVPWMPSTDVVWAVLLFDVERIIDELVREEPAGETGPRVGVADAIARLMAYADGSDTMLMIDVDDAARVLRECWPAEAQPAPDWRAVAAKLVKALHGLTSCPIADEYAYRQHNKAAHDLLADPAVRQLERED